MPYIRKRQRGRALWMTLVEAVNHINKQERTENGLDQIRIALGEGEIPARWAWQSLPEGPIKFEGRNLHFVPMPDPPLFVEDTVPNNREFWDKAIMLLDGDGKVIDPALGYMTIQRDAKVEVLCQQPVPWRGLFLLKETIFDFWPLADHSETDRKLQNVRAASEEEIRDAARELYSNSPAFAAPNIDKAERLIRAKLGKASRKLIRHVLSASEFASLRNPAGNQPKR